MHRPFEQVRITSGGFGQSELELHVGMKALPFGVWEQMHPSVPGQAARNTFWQSLVKAGARTYFSEHDHLLDVSRIDDNDENNDNDVYQLVTGTGGGVFPPKPGLHNGDNAPFTPVKVEHDVQNRYIVVQISPRSGIDQCTHARSLLPLDRSPGGFDR